MAQRLAALLCLTGAGLFGLAGVLVGRLDRAPGMADYRLPGGAALDPKALTVLTICAGCFALCGVALLLLAPASPPEPPAGRNRRRRPALVLMLGLAALLAAVAARHLGF